MTPGIEAGIAAAIESFGWGYAAGVGLVLVVMYARRNVRG